MKGGVFGKIGGEVGDGDGIPQRENSPTVKSRTPAQANRVGRHQARRISMTKK